LRRKCEQAKFSPERIIVFGRYPVPGETKTRLIPALGPVRAADLQRRLTERTLATVRRAAARQGIQVEVCYTGGSRRQLERWLGSDLIFKEQCSGNLGERMRSAFEQAFGEGVQRALLVGTDIPEMTAGSLREALDVLGEREIVLGPSLDGGYWMIGLRRPAEVFTGVDWGRPNVMSQTMELAAKEGLKVHTLARMRDLDTVEDLRQWQPAEAHVGPYISVIIPALNEEDNIARAINCARDDEVEIIVVDGDSRDGTVREALAAGARVVTGGPGRARQQNRGAAIAEGRVFVFLHADTLLPAGYKVQVFETLIQRGTSAGAFRFRTDAPGPLMKLIERVTNLRSLYLNLPYGDQGLFMLRNEFESAGGFPDVPIAEDFLLVRRLAKQEPVRLAEGYVTTSGRRWKMMGPLRVTLINQLVLSGCMLGISFDTLARLYHPPPKRKRLSGLAELEKM
jgi:hypothetical protein